MGKLTRIPAMAGAAVAGWLGFTAFRRRDYVPLPAPFPSEAQTVDTIGSGTVVLHRTHPPTAEGAPVVLVHSVNAAASAYEMRPIAEGVSGRHPVTAVDLPGFGHSARQDRAYTPDVMAEAVAAAVGAHDEPVHVVALSLGSEFAARAAALRPDLVRSVTMVSPTGLGRERLVEPTSTGWAGRVLDAPLVAQALFDLLATRRSIEWFLSRSFEGQVDKGLVNHAVYTSRQEGARHAPVDFLAGRLFTPRALETLYDPLDVPVLVLYDRDPYTDFADLPAFVAGGAGVRRAERVATTRGLPHFERTQETIDLLTGFWDDVDSLRFPVSA